MEDRRKTMAEKDDMVPENVPGRYYVDSNCTFCESCIEIAPENFAANADEYAYVRKQPEGEAEEEQCREALSSCPVDAIGDDGE
jgi:ferredoxin